MDHKTIVFIDANVALQCLDLKQLPWFEIDRKGPILVLVTPTVLREVDSKKNDGRLGDHARRFNGFLRPLLGTAETVNARPSPVPKVDVALARCLPIQWSSFPELDASEPDSRIIAEALHTETATATRKLFVSQDIRPLDLAKRHGFEIHHIGENWLRPKELSEAERKAAALTKELASLKSKQPELIFEWNTIDSPLEIFRAKDLSETERRAVMEQIRSAHPMPKQELSSGRFASILNDFNYDHTLEERYEKWSNRLLPAFVRQFEAKLELALNQIEVSFILKNIGKVQAESLLLELTATGGWLNDKLILLAPDGPEAPKRRTNRMLDIPRPFSIPEPTPPRGRHDVVVEEVPKRSNFARITCNDFRHGSDYEYKFVAWLDPRSDDPLKITAVATASNLHGESTSCLILQKKIEPSDVSELVDLKALKYRKQPLALTKLFKIKGDDYSAFEFEKFSDE